MRMKFIWVPAQDSAAGEAELNQFLAGHRVVEVAREFSGGAGQAPGWAVCVQWLADGETVGGGPVAGRTEKIDYREVLDPATFQIFSALRTWRKEAAIAEAVPIYRVATNEQLAKIARERIQTRAGLEQVEGFGESRLGRYAVDLLALCERLMAGAAVTVATA